MLQDCAIGRKQGTHPKRFTSKTLCQLSRPVHDVPLGAIAALFMSTPTCQSSPCEVVVVRARASSPIAGGSDGTTGCVRARSELAHLAPRLVHSVAEALDLLELRHVRREGDQVRVADDLRDLLRGGGQARLVDVRNRDLEADPGGGGQAGG